MEEALNDYLEKIHRVTLDMMVDLDRFLRENNIDYSLAYGAMIGAVRHKGFIPWDDDIDIFMKRDDYERFIKIYRSSGGIDGYFLYATDNPDSWLTHTKLFKKNTAMISGIEDLYAPLTKETEHKEIFIDIFPLDKVPTDKRKRKKYMFRAKMRLVYTRDHAYQATNNKILWLASKILLSIPKCFKRKIKNKTNKYVLKYNDLQSDFDYVCTAEPLALYEFLPPVLDETADMEFEGQNFKVYKEYDKILKVTYGDYMQLPKEEDRKPRHGKLVILDVDKFLSEQKQNEKNFSE